MIAVSPLATISRLSIDTARRAADLCGPAATACVAGGAILRAARRTTRQGFLLPGRWK